MVFGLFKGKKNLTNTIEYTVKNIVSSNFVAFHFESYLDKIIEISCVKVENSIIVDEFDSLIKYDDFKKDFISPSGITKEMLSYSPRPSKVMKKFHKFIGESLLVGYDSYDDMGLLIKSLNDLYFSFKNPVTDVKFFYKSLDGENKKMSFDELYKKYCNSALHDSKSLSRSLAIARLYLDFPYFKNNYMDDIEIKKDVALKISKGEKLSSIGRKQEALDIFMNLYNSGTYNIKVFENIICLLSEYQDDTDLKDFLFKTYKIIKNNYNNTHIYEKYYKGLIFDEKL